MEGINLEASIGGGTRRSSPVRRWSACGARLKTNVRSLRNRSGSRTPKARPSPGATPTRLLKENEPAVGEISRFKSREPRTQRSRSIAAHRRSPRSRQARQEKADRDWENMYHQSQARVRDLQRENQVLQAKQANLEQTNRTKLKTLGQERQMRLAANRGKFEIEKELERLRRKHENVFRKLSSCGIELETEGEDIKSLTDVLFGALDQMAHECERHQASITQYELEIHQKENRLQRQSNESMRLRENLSDSRGDYNKSVSSLSDRHRKQIKEWETTKAKKDAEIERLKNDRDTLAEENAKLSKKLERVINALKAMRQKLAEKDKLLRDYEVKLNERERENKELKKRLQGLTGNQFTNEALQKQLKESKVEIGDLATRLYDMERDFSDLKEQHDKYKERAEQEGSALRDERDDLHDALDGLKNVLKNISILGAKGIKNCKF